jgi:hypothetical protein
MEGGVTARLTRRPGGAARLRALLDSGQMIVAPGAFDPLAARLVEEAGFPAAIVGHTTTSASHRRACRQEVEAASRTGRGGGRMRQSFSR